MIRSHSSTAGSGMQRSVSSNRLRGKGASSKLIVSVRLRPVIAEDVQQANLIRSAPEICVCLKHDGQSIKLVVDQFQSKHFKVDHTFDTSLGQADVYETAFKPIVKDVLDGFNGTGFVYGQTGSGKTFTMFGSESRLGMAHFAVNDIFAAVAQQESNGLVAKVFMSFYQIYVEQVYDLLSEHKGQPPALGIREDSEHGVFVDQLTTLFVKDQDIAYRIIDQGLQHRKVQSTAYNVRSSRSHAVLQLLLDFEEAPAETHQTPPQQRYAVRRRKLMLVDLAGSERVPTHKHTSKQHMKEAVQINRSISALGNCICALSSQESNLDITHIPYRDCKLTRLLAEALGGNSKTALICTIGPCTVHIEETKSTLKFASRAKMIRKQVQKAIPQEIIFHPAPLPYLDGTMSTNPIASDEHYDGNESATGRSRMSRFSRSSLGLGETSPDQQQQENESPYFMQQQQQPQQHPVEPPPFSPLLQSPHGQPSGSAVSDLQQGMESALSPPSELLRTFLSPYKDLHVGGQPEQTFTLRDFLRACTLTNKAFNSDVPEEEGQEYAKYFTRTAEKLQAQQHQHQQDRERRYSDAQHSPQPRTQQPQPSPWARTPILRDPDSSMSMQDGINEVAIQTAVQQPGSPSRRGYDGSLDDFGMYSDKRWRDQEQQTDPLMLLPISEDEIVAEEVRQYQVEMIAQRDPMDLATQMWQMQQQVETNR